VLKASGTSIGASGAYLKTGVESLEAVSTNGGIFVEEADGLTLTSVSASGAGNDVEVTSTTGDIAVNTASANDVKLTATAGAITDDGNNATRIEADGLTLSAGTSIGTSGARL